MLLNTAKDPERLRKLEKAVVTVSKDFILSIYTTDATKKPYDLSYSYFALDIQKWRNQRLNCGGKRHDGRGRVADIKCLIISFCPRLRTCITHRHA